MAPRVFPPLFLGRLLHVLEEGPAAGLVLHLQEKLSALDLLLGCTLLSHNVVVEIGAQTEGGVGPHGCVLSRADSSLHLVE